MATYNSIAIRHLLEHAARLQRLKFCTFARSGLQAGFEKLSDQPERGARRRVVSQLSARSPSPRLSANRVNDSVCHRAAASCARNVYVACGPSVEPDSGFTSMPKDRTRSVALYAVCAKRRLGQLSQFLRSNDTGEIVVSNIADLAPEFLSDCR